MAQAGSGIQDELVRRHRATIKVVNGAFGLASLLAAVAGIRRGVAGGRMTAGNLLNELLGQAAPETAPDPVLQISLWLGIAFLALGAIYYRRTKFAPVRLKAVAGLRGAAGLIETLQKTTARVALIGAVIAVLGFVSSLLTGLFGDMLRAWLIAAVVLAYAYPRRGAWQRVVAAADAADVNTEPAAKGTFA